MKILVINPILFTADGGVIPQMRSIKDTMIYGMCMGFARLGHSVTLAAAKEYMPTENESYDFEVKFFPSDYTRVCKPAVLPYSRELKRWLKANHVHYDLVVASETFQFSTLFAARTCPEKTIIWHELALHQRKFHKIPSKLWYNIIVRLFMRKPWIVGRSIYARDFVRQYHKRTSEVCVEHGIDISNFIVCKEKENSFVVVSQLIERKNIPSIINKFAKLIEKPAYSDYRLLLIGRGSQENDLRLQVERMKLQQKVIFAGFMTHEQLQGYVGKAKALLIDTKQDNNMVSIPESLACGTPIVTNTIPTNAYIIKGNGLGIVKDDWDESDLSEIIENNARYVDKCLLYRDKLTNVYSAQALIDEYKRR